MWAADGVLAVSDGGAGPKPLGEAFPALHVRMSLRFPELEYIGLRKACAIVAA